ncbi:unnamed protein product [Alternaria alternata]
MVYIRFASVFAAASMVMMAAAADEQPTATKIKNPITTPTVTLPASAMTSIGSLFETSTPLENHGPYGFQSPGNCQLVAWSKTRTSWACPDGKECWCGDEIPAKDWQDYERDMRYPLCRRRYVAMWWKERLVGRSHRKHSEPRSTITSPTCPAAASAAPKPSSAAPTSTAAAQASATPSEAPKEDEDSKPNTVAIAVGVVVGNTSPCLHRTCLVYGSYCAGDVSTQAEEDYRRNAANVNAFVNGGKLHTSNSSMNDSRLDPSFVDRRQSNGSIADNEDYSRRILKVTNV